MTKKIFKDLIFVVGDLTTSQPKKEFIQQIKDLGGEVVTAISQRVTHLITNEAEVKRRNARVRKAENGEVAIVADAFVIDSIAKGTLQEEESYYLVTKEIASDEDDFVVKDNEEAETISHSETDDEEQLSKKSSKKSKSPHSKPEEDTPTKKKRRRADDECMMKPDLLAKIVRMEEEYIKEKQLTPKKSKPRKLKIIKEKTQDLKIMELESKTEDEKKEFKFEFQLQQNISTSTSSETPLSDPISSATPPADAVLTNVEGNQNTECSARICSVQ